MNEQNILDCIELDASKASKYAIIWLHGLGADGNDFVPIAKELDFSFHAHTRFIFPHAPIIPITMNNGYKMRAWCDISSLTLDAKIDEAGINRSITQINHLIQKEINRGIPSRNIFLAGFSQGAAMALAAGIFHPQPLGGIIALSGFLPRTPHLTENSHLFNLPTPIFLAHGTLDLVVSYHLGLATHEFLTKAGFKVDWHSYPIEHSVSNEEIRDISAWIEQRSAAIAEIGSQ